MSEKLPIVRMAVFCFVAVVCLWRLGSTPLLETDEGFAANRAASFYRHHTWRLSYDDVNDDNPQFRKPPLLYWAVAALYPVIGRNEWAVRLPGALASIAACWLLYRINRRHFDELTALGSVILFASVPFVLIHIRTAMLEIPLLALTLLTVYSLAYLTERRGSAVLAGFAAAGAVLVKGSPGFLALAVAAILTLFLDRFSARAWRRIGIAVLVTALIFGAYCFAVVPHQWRDTMLQSMFVSEGTHRTTAKSVFERFGAFANPLWDTCRYLIPLAVLGFALAIVRAWRKPETRGWFLLFALIAIPVVLVGVKQIVPYPRYFLPVYPFLATLAAVAISDLVRNRAVAAVLIGTTAALTFFSPVARNYNPSPREQPYPGIRELALQVPALVPEGEKLILVAGKLKCHQLLFYGQRAITSQTDDLKPGATRYAIIVRGRVPLPPSIETQIIDETDFFQLLRIHVLDSPPAQ